MSSQLKLNVFFCTNVNDLIFLGDIKSLLWSFFYFSETTKIEEMGNYQICLNGRLENQNDLVKKGILSVGFKFSKTL